MNVVAIAKGVKVLDIVKNENGEGQNKIEWTEVFFCQGQNYNKVTCDKKVAPELKVGSSFDLVLQVTEQPKAYRNGNGAFIENKFKIIGIDKPLSNNSNK